MADNLIFLMKICHEIKQIYKFFNRLLYIGFESLSNEIIKCLFSFLLIVGETGGKRLPPSVPPLLPPVPFVNCLQPPAFFQLTWLYVAIIKPSYLIIS